VTERVWSLQSLDFWCCYRPDENLLGDFRNLGREVGGSSPERCLDKTLPIYPVFGRLTVRIAALCVR